MTSTGNATRSRHSAAAAAATSGGTRSAFDSASSRGSAAEPRVVLGQLALDHLEVALRIRAVQRREVEHVHQQPGALDVREEVVAEPGAVADAPSISPGMSASTSWRSSASIVPSTGSSVVNGYAATFGCARVMRDSSEDLPAFGQPDEPDVGEQLEVQLDDALLARQPALGQPRRLARRRSRTSCCRARPGRRAAIVTSWPGRTRS